MKRKQIICSGHEPIHFHHEYSVPWSDTWISWKTRPGRRRVKWGPTLVTFNELLSDLVSLLSCQRDNPDLDYGKDIARTRAAYDAIRAGATFFIDLNEDYPEYPNVFTSAKCIDCKEAERLLTELLKTRGITNPRFRWKKCRDFVTPASFRVTAEEIKELGIE